jgi:tetratricopeptide (TPR) repeat protein
MGCNILFAILLVAAEAPQGNSPAGATIEAVVKVPQLAQQADTSYLVQRWDRAADQYAQLVEANPTNGYFWFRLGMSRLETGKYDDAAAAFGKAEELGGFQWNPPRMVFRGESAWGLAAAHARAGRKDEAIRWTRKALSQGLRDIRRFHGKHFASLMDDPEFRTLVWATDVKGLSRDEGFRYDLRFLMHEAKRIHYAPFRETSEAELDSLAQSLDSDIPNLTDDQLLVRTMGLVRRLGDGHTQIGRPGKRLRLPLRLFQFPEGLYITGGLPQQADLVGAKILMIGERSADEALKLTGEIASRDNPMTVRSFAPALLGSPAILRGLGLVSTEGPVAFEIEDALGKKRRVELAPVNVERSENRWVYRVAGNDKPLPLSLRSRNKTYWFEFLSDQRAIYCQLNGIGTDDQKTLSDFCKELFAAVAQPEVEALIIDVRYNGGGNTFMNPPLIEGIVRSDKLQKSGSLFLIIGRATFSAAQNTVSELERRTKAILVGEPTGSRPNFIGESLAIPLPHSGWVLSLSDLWWQNSMAMDYRTWTPPHLHAPPTAAAFRAHADPAMDVIAAYRALAVKAK